LIPWELPEVVMDRQPWDANRLGQVMRGYQASCVLAAGAELDAFAVLARGDQSAGELAAQLRADRRGVRTLLDAMAALGFLEKRGERYHVPPDVAGLLIADRPGNQLAMVRHQANCLRNWAQLAAVVKRGVAATRSPSIRGAEADYAAFIDAMDNIASTTAAGLVAALPRMSFSRLLDVGGASGSYTIAFLRAYPAARATLFDLPQVMPQARMRLTAAGVMERVTLVPGDFYVDALPEGADLAWISAIVHQNSREQNRALFGGVYNALAAGGTILVRDFIMEPSRVHPPGGALFAINMLVNTPAGGTFTRDELREDLAAAGFADCSVLVQSDTMNSVLAARKA
jgi:predicted O-methyltransferase YrrM